jgi:alpha-beta hydrolase superfamily lysophospholipase
MQYREFGWQTQGGKNVFACEWLPDDETVQAVVVIVHGMGEHTGRYRHVAEMLTRERYAVLAFDQLGHGRTEGKRGHARSYEDLLHGIDRLRDEAARRFPGKPVILYGHSMGGNLTINYILRRTTDLAGAIASSPWLKLAFAPPSWKTALARVIHRVWPTYTERQVFLPTQLTSDPEMCNRIINDPLGHGFISARYFLEVHRAGKYALEHAADITVPLLLMHGDADSVTSTAASRLFAQRAGSICTYREWPVYRHELHNESGREEVFREIREWIKKRLA